METWFIEDNVEILVNSEYTFPFEGNGNSSWLYDGTNPGSSLNPLSRLKGMETEK